MIFFIRHLIAILVIFSFSIVSYAAVPAWTIIPTQSTLTFTATQNDAPISGQFKTFTGDIHFDPEQLSESKIHIVVDMNSLSTSYEEVADTLKTPDWLSIKLFPQALFDANQITATGDKTYQAKGTLTIRDKKLPVTVSFTLEKYSKTEALVKGSATIKRTVFGVGRGDWAKTDNVKDEVQINFMLSAKPTVAIAH